MSEPKSKQHGMLFSAPMVLALINTKIGESTPIDPSKPFKTQTRRVMKPQPSEAWARPPIEIINGKYCSAGCVSDFKCPHPVGTEIYCKETFYDSSMDDKRHPWTYRAGISVDEDLSRDFAWRPSIFMPKEAARVWHTVVKVRCERVQDITQEDAVKEGLIPYEDHANMWHPTEQYQCLWNSINLAPSPVFQKVDGKKRIVAYESYPWSMEDFAARYPIGTGDSGFYFKGKPLHVYPNPYVWVYDFLRTK